MDFMLDWIKEIPWIAEIGWLYRIVYSIIVVCIAVVLSFIIRRAVKRIIQRRTGKNRRAATLTKLAGSTASYVVKFLALVQVLKVGLDFDITSILAAAGVLGLAVGFGAQSLVKDVITGFFILFENQYSVGERVLIDGFEGKVLELGLRSTKVQAEDDGRILYIPNGAISKVINYSRTNGDASEDNKGVSGIAEDNDKKEI